MSDHLIDAEALDRSLRHLRGSTGNTEVSDALGQVIHATQELFGTTGAGIMMVDEGSMLRYVAATDEAGRLLEVRQQELGHGPCVDSLLNDRVTRVEDLAEDPRWPELLPELPDAGVRAVLGIPIHADYIAVGSLNVYCDVPRTWSDSEVAALQAYASLIGNMLHAALRARERGELAEQLQHALDHRVVIERAVGVIMGRDAVDAVTAFNSLRHQARSAGRKVADVATELLSAVPAGR